MENTLKISYFSYLTTFGGYGISGLNHMTHLKRAGVEVFPYPKFKPEVGTPEYLALTEEQVVLLETPYEKQKIGVIEMTPFDFNLIDTDIKIAITMCESSKIGGSWVKACNSMDHVFLPNEFQKRAFQESGVNVPLDIVRLGTWTEMFPYYERPERDVFTFGTVGWLNDRKGVFDLIRAFVSEFSPEEPVRLYLKSSNKDFGYYSYFSDPRIKTDIRHLKPQELNEIYKSFDCFVFPSKAEGVGQPPREAMSTGLPTIVTNYSGLEEIADEKYAYPLQPAGFETGTNPVKEQTGDWAKIDIQELMYQMRYVYEHQKEAKEKGRLASKEINENHSWEKCAADMIKLLNKIKENG